jgi:aspartyl-tRNA(Asn)/glutamyl-tRNA(Gln) amidotransferase subunit A
MDNYFIQAQRIRRLVQRDFDLVFAMRNPLGTSSVPADHENDGLSSKVDVIIGPTSSSPPPSLASVLNDNTATKGASAPLDSYVTDAFTVPASLAGLPAISVPVPVLEDTGSGLDKVGIQIIGQYGDDDLVLMVGEVLEQAEFTD